MNNNCKTQATTTNIKRQKATNTNNKAVATILSKKNNIKSKQATRNNIIQ